MTSISYFTEEADRIVNFRAADENANAAAFLIHLAEKGYANPVLVRGWTPSFNDGDPCEHRTEVFVNVLNIAEESGFDSFDEEEICLEGLSEALEDDDEAVAFCEKNGLIYEGEDTRSIERAIEKVLVPVLDRDHGTNYAVLYIISNGVWRRYVTEYDCGY